MLMIAASDDTFEFARLTCETVIVILIAFEPVKNSFLQSFIARLLQLFILEELVIFAGVFINYLNIYTEWLLVISRLAEIIRIMITLSFCYPISVFIGETLEKFQSVFVYICCLMIIGTMSDLLHFNDSCSGVNYIALLIIFAFTLYQYNQLRQRKEGEIPRLDTLILLELILIALDTSLILIFFNAGWEQKFLPSIKLAMEFVQLLKFYLMISVMAYFD